MLADIRTSDRVSRVMVNGRLYDSATMDEVGGTARKRRPFFFERTPGSYVPASDETLPGRCEH